MTFSDEELDRYARHIVLPTVGGAGQARLKAASAAIVGAGGIGSAVIQSLAGAGIGRLTIIDDDVVDLSNLSRQPIFRSDQVGQPKTDAAQEFVLSFNPFVETLVVRDRIDASNAAGILSGHSIIIDGSDNFATRLAVSDASVAVAAPLVSAAAVQFQGQVGLWRGWESDQPCYRCFVGDAFDAEDCDNCAELGVLGALVGTAGHFAAFLAVRSIVGIADDMAGKVHVFDGQSLSWRHVQVTKDPACRTCGGTSAPHP